MVVANVLIKWDAADLFDEVTGDAEARIGIGHARARRPANVLRFLEALKDFEKGKIVAIVEVIDFGCLHVVESRSVFEQIYDSHGIRGLPGVFDWDFRRNILQARFEINFSFLLQLQEGERDKRFADRAYTKFRVASNVAAGGHVRFAEVRHTRASCHWRPERRLRPASDACRGHPSWLFATREAYRMRQLFFLLGAGDWGRQQKGGKAQAHGKPWTGWTHECS